MFWGRKKINQNGLEILDLASLDLENQIIILAIYIRNRIIGYYLILNAVGDTPNFDLKTVEK
jgi:hypothetical protein